ncbi:MAG: hypothetical protein WD749_02210 [Phycisphaerales bacterium]
MDLPASRPFAHAAVLASLALTGVALAQEATNTPAATQPAEGKLYLRQRVQYFDLGDDPSPKDRDIDKVVATTSLTYGLRRDMSLSLDVPVVYAIEDTAAGTERDVGLSDVALTFKYRPVQIDLNPIDSVRFAVFGGLEIPSGDGDFSSQSLDPFIGGVFTAILGRHGLNQSLSYKLNTGGDRFDTRAGDGPSNALRYDTAYLFRLAPAQYAADTAAATYLTLELNGLYETSGDNEILLGPGILYEARTFALEAAVGIPVVQEVDERPETSLVVTLGFRVLF